MTGNDRTSKAARAAVRLSLLLALPLLGGCNGDDGPPRRPVAGEVQLDGKPLASGTITFAPVEGGAGSFGQIVDGAYRFGAGDGPSPGRHHVEIVSVQSSGRTIASPDIPGATIEEVRNVIPPRYNAQTDLRVDVKPDGDNQFRFELTSADVGHGGKKGRKSRR